VQGLAHPESLGGPRLDNRRIAAALIDAAVLAVIVLLLGTLTGGFGGLTVVLALAWTLYYFFAFEWGADGQTLGKRVMGLRVARADGGRPGIRQVAVRTALRLIDGFGFYLVGLAAMLATGERRQRLGDLAAGTVVTAVDAGPAPLAPAPEAAPTEELEPEPQAPDTSFEPPPAPPIPGIADSPAEPDPGEQPAPPAPPLAKPAEEPAAEEAAPEEPAPDEPSAPQSPTGSIEVVPAIDLVMQDDDEDERSRGQDAGPDAQA
jgi:uncharacterized RDD family membrane protein YckC